MILTVTLLLLLISLKDLLALIRKSRRKEIIWYVIFTFLNVVMAVLAQWKINFPTPHLVIHWLGRQWLG